MISGVLITFAFALFDGVFVADFDELLFGSLLMDRYLVYRIN